MSKEQLISKKALLEKYQISYGALYRYKRKGLIPEEWFIKQSTITGQETFFPEKLICERIELILSTKDEMLLDVLAKKLSKDGENTEAIVLQTAFGEKKIDLKDLKKIELIKSTGEIIDVTNFINELLKGE